MSENLFERNLGALAACSPRSWEDVASGTEDLPRVALRVFPSASGSPALEASREGARCLVHSARDPAGEAERFVDPCLDGSEEIVVVFGFGRLDPGPASRRHGSGIFSKSRLTIICATKLTGFLTSLNGKT